MADEDIPHDSQIAVTGWGNANSAFVIKIYVDGVLRVSHAGTVSPEDNVVENVAPPVSTNVWTSNVGETDGSYELRVNNDVVSQRDIVFQNGVGGA